jgi:hypothetical protein
MATGPHVIVYWQLVENKYITKQEIYEKEIKIGTI